jgi:hypothetical protein
MRPTILAAAAAEEGRTMWLRFLTGLIIASLFLVFMGDRTAHAQGFPFFESYPYANPYPSGRPSYYPGAPVQPDARRPVYREERRVRRPVYREERQARRPVHRAERTPRRHVRVAPAVEPRKAQPEKPAIEPSTYIVVFGDSLADLVSDGLEEAYDEAPEIEVVNKAKGDSGLVRNDVHDWPKVIQDYLNGNPQITFAVMMVGVNDRQAIREGEVTHDPLSDRWKEIYRDRVDAVARAFAEQKIPLLWISAPPTKNEKFSADLIAMNDIYRERVQKAGGVYVDIGPGFVNDENRYTPVGPGVDGQTARLRASDGIHFTDAGARKAAHFAEVEIKRLLEARSGTRVTTPAPAAVSREAVDGQVGASPQPAPEPAGLPSPLPTKPVAGPVLPLTRPEVSPNGALLTGQLPIDKGADVVERAYRQGVAPGPRPGRADDFKWPRS